VHARSPQCTDSPRPRPRSEKGKGQDECAARLSPGQSYAVEFGLSCAATLCSTLVEVVIASRLIVVLLILIPEIARAESSSTAEPVLTVCEVLQRLHDLRGKMIAVRGSVVETWLTSGPYVRAEDLRGPACPGVPDTWRPVILLDRPTSDGSGTFSAEYDRPFSFQEQPPTLTALLAQMRAEGPNSDYVATVIGELVTKEDLSIIRLRNGLVKGNGYQGGAFPAVLLVKTVRNPVRGNRFRSRRNPITAQTSETLISATVQLRVT
jgi:hypothetical protein